MTFDQTPDMLAAEDAAKAREARLDTMRECARAVCGKCECLQEPRQTNDGIWWHQHFYSHKDTECPAGPIHDLIADAVANPADRTS